MMNAQVKKSKTFQWDTAKHDKVTKIIQKEKKRM